MNKEIYLLRGTDQERYPEFYNRIFNMTTVLAKKINPEALKFTITSSSTSRHLHNPVQPEEKLRPYQFTKITPNRLKNSGRQKDFTELTG